MKFKTLQFLFLISLGFLASFKPGELTIARLQYSGGGDWYANPTSLPNLAAFASKQLGIKISSEIATVKAESSEIFNYPFIHMTGHGNVVFSNDEIANLRSYLMGGGFLHIDDNYGMDPYVRLELSKIFPSKELIELPNDHPIYRQKFTFKNGVPKVHEHDGKNAQALAILEKGRVLVLYTYECDLGDGWEDQDVHNDPESVRLEALKMGANMLQYAFTAN